jgi:hypothetical protein
LERGGGGVGSEGVESERDGGAARLVGDSVVVVVVLGGEAGESGREGVGGFSRRRERGSERKERFSTMKASRGSIGNEYAFQCWRI